jgi:hypothetical protein
MLISWDPILFLLSLLADMWRLPTNAGSKHIVACFTEPLHGGPFARVARQHGGDDGFEDTKFIPDVPREACPLPRQLLPIQPLNSVHHLHMPISPLRKSRHILTFIA